MIFKPILLLPITLALARSPIAPDQPRYYPRADSTSIQSCISGHCTGTSTHTGPPVGTGPGTGASSGASSSASPTSSKSGQSSGAAQSTGSVQSSVSVTSSSATSSLSASSPSGSSSTLPSSSDLGSSSSLSSHSASSTTSGAQSSTPSSTPNGNATASSSASSTATSSTPGSSGGSSSLPGSSGVTASSTGSSSATISSSSTTEVPVTLTTLPTSASLVTLTNTQSYTTPVYITTTSPGGHDSTVVPVIIPTGKPPVVCFGCYTEFPPNIEINDSKSGFCVQLFGLKIGNCPPDEGGNNTGGGDDHPTQTDPNSSGTSASETSSSSSSSCTQIVTVTSRSVFCSVTSGASTTGCTTQAFTTSASCSGQNSATTTVSTATASVTDPVCAPDTCGSGFCTNSKRADTPALEVKPRDVVKSVQYQKRGDPDEGDWVDKDDYSNNYKSMTAGEVFAAYHKDEVMGGDYISVVPFAEINAQDNMMTTSATIMFKDKVLSLAVEGLWGCTSVIVVSRRGAYASHIWEPSFNYETDQDRQLFQERAINQLRNGLGASDPNNPYGLDDLMGGNEDQTKIFGGEGVDDPHTQVFFVAPRPRVPIFDQNNQATPDNVRQDENANAGQLAFGPRLDDIRDSLSFLDTSDFTTVEYSPKVLSFQKLMSNPSPQDVMKDLGDESRTDHRGKVYLQYQPAKTQCGDQAGRQAAWRLFVEGNPVGSKHDEWDAIAGYGQVFGQSNANPKRQDSCPISSQSGSGTASTHSGTTTGTATGTASATTTGGSSSTSQASPSGSSGSASSTKSSASSGTALASSVSTHSSSSSTPTSSSSTKESSSSTTTKASTTTTPSPTPTPTQTPDPTEGVYIQFMMDIIGSEGGVAAAANWVMFGKQLDGKDLKVCDIDTDADTSASGNISPNDVPWPVDFSADEIMDRKNCKYHHDDNGPGSFSCDDVDEFDCIEDDQNGDKIDCNGDGGEVKTFVPKVRCYFPA
ncbi:hypothetical protein G7054_g14750 [Neopestalotiopsis clavispora]|nr:hypothetical protein G7054_g14750 [Neopestalotiopsis clavispora]